MIENRKKNNRLTKSIALPFQVYKSQRFRAGRGKMRNRRRIQRRGPLIVYSKDDGLKKAFRNIPGVETMNVNKMSLLKLAPGGHVGRFVIWTEAAFKRLNNIFGTWEKKSLAKKGYSMPQTKMANPDLERLLKSEEITSVLRRPKKNVTRHVRRLNPLVNTRALIKLNPYAEVVKRRAILAAEKRKVVRSAEIAKRRGVQLPAKSTVARTLRRDTLRVAQLAKRKPVAKKVAAKK